MLNLLNTVEQRRLEFASILVSRKDWVDLGEIAETLGCTKRILTEDISYFRKHFQEVTFETSTQGVRALFNQNSGLKSFYQYTLKNSFAFQLLETLFLKEGQAIIELSNRFFISLSSMYRLINRVNENLKFMSFALRQILVVSLVMKRISGPSFIIILLRNTTWKNGLLSH